MRGNLQARRSVDQPCDEITADACAPLLRWGMADVHDTQVERMRREVERPRTDARRPMLLIAIVTTSAMAGAALMGLMMATQRGAPVAVPAVAPVAVPAPAPVVAPVAPVAPAALVEPALAPEARTPRPCPGYQQKSVEGDAPPARTDCL